MVLHSVDKFWKLWSNDYLNTLHQRYKWRIKENNLKIGEIVLIKKQNLPPSNWPLGKILEMHPGDDNLVRVVTIKPLSLLKSDPFQISSLCQYD